MESEGSPTTMICKTPEDVTGWGESIILTVLQTSVGQSVFKLIDSFLWAVEKSAQWSLPAQEITAEENGKVFGKVEFIRPLPWVLFLPGLVILRMIKAGLNVGAFVLGYPQIQPSGMVKFVQRGRRRLRTVNLKAIKCARRKVTNNKDKRLTMIEAKKALIRSIRLTLYALSCVDSKSPPSPPPTKIRITGMDFEVAATPDEKSTTESTGSPVHTEMKRRFSQVSTTDSNDESEEETLQSKIDRLAQDESSDDPDFNPAECSSQSSTSSEEEANIRIPLEELKDLKIDQEMYKSNMQSCTKLPGDQKPSDQEAEKSELNVERADSPETETQKTSRVTNDFISGEKNSAETLSTAGTTQRATSGVTGKPSSQTSGSPPEARQGSQAPSKESAPRVQERKYYSRKRWYRHHK